MDFEEYCREKQHSPYCSRAEAFTLGQQSKQAEIDALKKKYDAMYNAFVVADDCRKEWHGCFTRAKEEKDRLQSMINNALNEIEGGVTGRHHVKSIIKILKGEFK